MFKEEAVEEAITALKAVAFLCLRIDFDTSVEGLKHMAQIYAIQGAAWAALAGHLKSESEG